MQNDKNDNLENRYSLLKKYFNKLKREIKKYPIGSHEYDEIISQMSDLSVELSIAKANLRSQNRIWDRLNHFLGQVILGEKEEQIETRFSK